AFPLPSPSKMASVQTKPTQAVSQRSQREGAAAAAAPGAVQGAGPIDGAKSANEDFVRFLYAPHGPQADTIISAIETNTKLKREQIGYAVGGAIGLLLVFGSIAQLLCNLIGFAYPAYVSVKAIRSPSKDDDTKWLTYWTVFGFMCVIDFFADSIMGYFPFFYLAKAVFLAYLYLPQTNGAEYCYTKYVDPAVTKFDAWFAQKFGGAVKQE
ncbi:hypothetical protein PFISCL1PPCAC_19330, partial [Pristionchus fissidentatus]